MLDTLRSTAVTSGNIALEICNNDAPWIAKTGATTVGWLEEFGCETYNLGPQFGSVIGFFDATTNLKRIKAFYLNPGVQTLSAMVATMAKTVKWVLTFTLSALKPFADEIKATASGASFIDAACKTKRHVEILTERVNGTDVHIAGHQNERIAKKVIDIVGQAGNLVYQGAKFGIHAMGASCSSCWVILPSASIGLAATLAGTVLKHNVPNVAD